MGRKKDVSITNIGKDMEQLELSDITDGTVNWHHHFRILFSTVS